MSVEFPKLAPNRPLGQGALEGEHFALDTALEVEEGQGAVIEAGTGVPFAAVVQDPEDGDALEIVLVTGVEGDTLTLAAPGLVCGWPTGTLVRRMVVREELQLMQDVIAQVEADTGELVADLEEFLEDSSELVNTIWTELSGVLAGTRELPGLKLAQYNSTGLGAFLNWTYARGTAESKVDTTEGDFVGRWTFNGWATGLKRMAGIHVYQGPGAAGAGIPGALALFVVKADNNPIAELTLNQDGITLGGATITVGGGLKHVGAAAGFFNTTPVAKPVITGWSGKTAEQKVDAIKDALVALGLVGVS